MNVLDHVVQQHIKSYWTKGQWPGVNTDHTPVPLRKDGMLPFSRIEHKMVCLPVKDTAYFLCWLPNLLRALSMKFVILFFNIPTVF